MEIRIVDVNLTMAKAFELVTNDIDQAGGKSKFIDDSYWCDLWHGCCTELEITLRAKLRAAGYNIPLNGWEKDDE